MIERFYPANDKVLNFKFVQNDEDFIVEEQAIRFSGAGSFLVLKIERRKDSLPDNPVQGVPRSAFRNVTGRRTGLFRRDTLHPGQRRCTPA